MADIRLREGQATVSGASSFSITVESTGENRRRKVATFSGIPQASGTPGAALSGVSVALEAAVEAPYEADGDALAVPRGRRFVGHTGFLAVLRAANDATDEKGSAFVPLGGGGVGSVADDDAERYYPIGNEAGNALAVEYRLDPSADKDRLRLAHVGSLEARDTDAVVVDVWEAQSAPSTGTITHENALTHEQLEKLDGIEAGAEVNVQADWNEQDSASDAFIRNKPPAAAPFSGDFDDLAGVPDTASRWPAYSEVTGDKPPVGAEANPNQDLVADGLPYTRSTSYDLTAGHLAGLAFGTGTTLKRGDKTVTVTAIGLAGSALIQVADLLAKPDLAAETNVLLSNREADAIEFTLGGRRFYLAHDGMELIIADGEIADQRAIAFAVYGYRLKDSADRRKNVKDGFADVDLSNRGNVQFSADGDAIKGHVDLPADTGAEEVLASFAGTPAERQADGVTAGIVLNQSVTIDGHAFTVKSIDYEEEHLSILIALDEETQAAFRPLSVGVRGGGFRETFARAEFSTGDQYNPDFFEWRAPNPMVVGTPIVFDLYEAAGPGNYVAKPTNADNGRFWGVDAGEAAWRDVDVSWENVADKPELLNYDGLPFPAKVPFESNRDGRVQIEQHEVIRAVNRRSRFSALQTHAYVPAPPAQPDGSTQGHSSVLIAGVGRLSYYPTTDHQHALRGRFTFTPQSQYARDFQPTSLIIATAADGTDQQTLAFTESNGIHTSAVASSANRIGATQTGSALDRWVNFQNASGNSAFVNPDDVKNRYLTLGNFAKELQLRSRPQLESIARPSSGWPNSGTYVHGASQPIPLRFNAALDDELWFRIGFSGHGTYAIHASRGGYAWSPWIKAQHAKAWPRIASPYNTGGEEYPQRYPNDESTDLRNAVNAVEAVAHNAMELRARLDGGDYLRFWATDGWARLSSIVVQYTYYPVG